MGKSSEPQQTVSTTELPPWLTAAAQQNIQTAQQIAQTPYQPYTGSVVAGLSPAQLQAFQMAQQNVGSYQPALSAALGAATGAANYTPQNVVAPSFLNSNIQSYMNPYLAEVEQRATENINRQLAQTQNQIASQAVQSRAFGGSRQGVQEGIAAGEAARAAGDLSAQLRAQAFQQAAALQQADQASAMQAALANQQAGLAGAGLGLQGAGVLTNLAGQQQQLGLTDVGAIGAVGQQQQAQQQAELDAAYAAFLQELNYPIQGLNLQLAAVGATPYGQTTTQTTTGGPQGSGLATGIGAAGSFLSGLAALGTF